MKEKRVKLIYIAGSGRSGSTILSMLLGELYRFFDVGEIRFLWDRGLIDNMRCGCSKPFKECETWSKVLSHAGFKDKKEYMEMAKLSYELNRFRYFVFHKVNLNKSLKRKAEDYSFKMNKLFSSICEVTGCDVIVDSSKMPSYGKIISRNPNIEFYVIHIIRDCRAVVYSWSRKKKYEIKKNIYMDRFGTVKASFMWLLANLSAHYYWGYSDNKVYKIVRYENFVKNPKETLNDLLRFLHIPISNTNVFNNKCFEILKKHHTVAGNPVRFLGGSIEIKPDNSWKKNMKFYDILIATIICMPLIYLYKIVFKNYFFE